MPTANPRNVDPKVGVKVMRDFKGVNTQANRIGVDPDEFSWLENAMPIGNANLKAVPADPFGKGALRLTFVEEHAIVYSIGPDGRDDGGQPLARGTDPPTGDVILPR